MTMFGVTPEALRHAFECPHDGVPCNFFEGACEYLEACKAASSPRKQDAAVSETCAANSQREVKA